MTEREYIEWLLERASAYVDAIDGVLTTEAVEGWDGAKMGLSAHTMIYLCKLWIANDNTASKTWMEETAMWRNADRDWPDLGVQVVGISRSEGYEDLAFWTRTDDGWYVSDKNGSLGNRDAVTKERSRGPSVWCHAPKIDKRKG